MTTHPPQTLYQLVLKRPSGMGATWLQRPYSPTRNLDEVLAQYHQVPITFANTLERVVLEGHDENDLAAQYDEYSVGRACRIVDLTADGLRIRIEFAPVRETFYNPPQRPASQFPFRKDELHGLIRLMTRVQAGELGGPDDGAD